MEWSEAVLKRPLEQCLNKFAALGILNKDTDFTAQLAEYRALWPTVRSTAVRFLQLGRRQLEYPPKGEIKALLRFLNVRWLDPDYAQRLCKFFGLISMEQLKTPNIVPEVADTLVIPTYDLPGRYAGMLLITLHDEEPPVLGYRSFPKLAGLEKYNMCAGLALLPQALEVRGVDKYRQPDLLVYCDTVDAAKAYLRWLRTSSEAIPMVIPVQQSLQSTKTVWHSLPQSKLIFAGSLDSTLGYASRSAGEIAVINNCPFQGVKNALFYIQELKDKALPWQQVVVNKLLGVPAAQRTDAFMKMDIATASRESFLNQVPLELKQQLTSPLSEGNWRTFQFQWRAIVETANGWQLTNKKPLSNGIIRIDRIITYKENFHTRLQGRVLFKGVIYPFEIKMNRVNKHGLFHEIARYLSVEHGCITFRYRKEWNTRALDLAIAAYTPQVIKSIPIIGWAAAEQKFVLNRFVIERDGTVNNNWLQNTQTQTEYTPTFDLPPPTDVFPSNLIPPLEQTDVNSQAIWMLTAAVLHNVLAPYVGRPMDGVAVGAHNPLKHKTSPLMHAASYFGCGTAAAVGCERHRVTLRQRAAEKHNWPINFKFYFPRSRKELEINPYQKKLIIAASPAAAFTLDMLPVPEPLGFTVNNWASTMQNMLPHILRFILQQKIAPMTFGNDLLLTYSIIERWLIHIGANTDGLAAARDLYKTMTTPEYLMVACARDPALTTRAYNYLMKAQKISWVYLHEHIAKPYSPEDNALHIFKHDGYIFVSKRNFEQYRRTYLAFIAANPVQSGYTGTQAPVKNPDDYYIFKEDKWNEACKAYNLMYSN